MVALQDSNAYSPMPKMMSAKAAKVLVAIQPMRQWRSKIWPQCWHVGASGLTGFPQLLQGNIFVAIKVEIPLGVKVPPFPLFPATTMNAGWCSLWSDWIRRGHLKSVASGMQLRITRFLG